MFASELYKRRTLFSSCDNGVTVLPGSLPVSPGVRGNLPVFTTTLTGM